MRLEFWFEFGSTYSYPAAMRIEHLAGAHNVELLWKPFLLGPIFNNQGWNDSPFNTHHAKGKYMWRDMERICEAESIPLKKPSVFPRNGLLASRIACTYAAEKWIPDFIRSVYSANFAMDLDISDSKVIKSCIPSVAGCKDTVVDQALTPSAKERLRNNTDRAQLNGIFGAPSFVVGEELFWGNDRLESAIEWAQNV